MPDQRMDEFDCMGEERDFIDEMDEEDNGRGAGEIVDDYEMVCILIPSHGIFFIFYILFR